jgi:hypothetical protein
MSIGRLFSGSGGRKAAVSENMYNLEHGLEPSLNNVNRAATNAAGNLRSGFSQARDAVMGSQAPLTQGRDAAQGFLSQAVNEYQPFLAGTMRGFDAYGDAAGANGADGIGRANSAFRQIEGYQGGLNTGLDQLERRAAQRGALGGGNTSADTIRFASDYDAQNFGRYLSGLSPYLSAAGGANNTMATMRGRQADVETAYGRDMSSSLASLGSLFAGEGTALAGNDWREGQAANDVRALYVPRMAGKIGEGMQAGDKAAANQLGAIMGGANLLSNFAGQAMGGSGLGGLSRMFGGGTGAGAALGGGQFAQGAGGYNGFGPFLG